jgi:hypothetical protein
LTDDAIRASRPEARNQNVTTVLMAIVARETFHLVLLISSVRIQCRVPTGMDFGFVTNCGWGKGPGNKVAPFASDLIVM